jgi:acetoin utilization deacetylase AcuC-like enzyme
MKVFYRDEQTVQLVDVFSPSARKPAVVVRAWQDAFGASIELAAFEPLHERDFHAAHDRAYVRGVFSLATENGFGTRSQEVAESLRYTNGSMVAAALHALEYREFAVSPTSGFHHAGWAYGGAFCTFNGLMLAALAARAAGAARVAIVDCDQHYGNGTDDIIGRLNAQSWLAHYTYGQQAYAHRPGGAEFLADLERVCRRVASEADLILYQAGADPHRDDPLGGSLGTEEMRRRDEILFEAARAASLPLAWNLAGGYQEPLQKVVDLHVQTMGAALAVQRDWRPARKTGCRRLRKADRHASDDKCAG